MKSMTLRGVVVHSVMAVVKCFQSNEGEMNEKEGGPCLAWHFEIMSQSQNERVRNYEIMLLSLFKYISHLFVQCGKQKTNDKHFLFTAKRINPKSLKDSFFHLIFKKVISRFFEVSLQVQNIYFRISKLKLQQTLLLFIV